MNKNQDTKTPKQLKFDRLANLFIAGGVCLLAGALFLVTALSSNQGEANRGVTPAPDDDVILDLDLNDPEIIQSVKE